MAAAVDSLSASGSHIDVQSTILETGGSVPKGRADQIKLHGVGTTRDGSTALRVTFGAASGKTAPSFDIVVTDTDLYGRQHGATSAWRSQEVEAANFLFVPARLPLLREAALLSIKATQGGISHVDQGFARKYTFTPADDQLLQMLVNSFGGTAAEFLKTASGHLDFFIGTNGKLLRIETHLVATNPDTRAKQQIDAVTAFSGGSSGPIPVPADAQPVATGSSLFTTGP